ncbi:MAG: phosphopyruvate hydratase, partial [Candidatus Diapherotrites archaeon]|nr:phosphopyruvate hydratase [Candidatus Diapherotrites archaeon]
MKIISIKSLQVLDSRGNPTVYCRLRTEAGFFESMVPSGASTGVHEALELRDGGNAWAGKGVQKAVENINGPIAKKLAGLAVEDQRDIDAQLVQLDGSPDKSNLGANAILAVSMVVCRAGAASHGMELFEYIGKLAENKRFVLPVPQLNVMNGGRHAGLSHDIQEQMFVPQKFKSFSDALRAGVESYQMLQKILVKRFGSTAALLGDEGGFVPAQLRRVEDRLALMRQAVEEAGYLGKISFALDAAASEFFEDDAYHLGEQKYSANELVSFYDQLCREFGVVSLEDGLDQDDWDGWQLLTRKTGSFLQLVGDDLLVTNPKRIETAISKRACNALLLKVNQIGSVSESIDAFRLARDAKWNVVVSHRSGETEDSFIADLVVGLAAGQSKFGAPA